MSVLPIVLVDARNVLRSQWPNLPEEELVERCRAWAEREGVCVVTAFDGRAPGDLLGERVVSDLLTLVGTGSGSADDWLTGRAALLAAAGTRSIGSSRATASYDGARVKAHLA